MNLSIFTNTFSKCKFWTKQHGPELLIGTGIALMAGSIISACVATTKLNKITKPAGEKIEKLHQEDKTKETRKALVATYAKTTGKILWIYSPAILTFGLSVSCFLGSHNILKGRNIALAAAYTTLENGYKAYREKVKEKLGEEAENILYKELNTSHKKVEKKDSDDGLKANDEIQNVKNMNPYTALYTCGNRGWERDACLNYDYLMTQQAYLNHKLQAQGFLFLSDVYDALGFDANILGAEKIRASHILGWIYDPTDQSRDNYVSFGLTNKNNVAKKNISEQLSNNEPNFWLEFNCDGDILNLAKDPRKKTFSNFAKEGCC